MVLHSTIVCTNLKKIRPHQATQNIINVKMIQIFTTLLNKKLYQICQENNNFKFNKLRRKIIFAGKVLILNSFSIKQIIEQTLSPVASLFHNKRTVFLDSKDKQQIFFTNSIVLFLRKIMIFSLTALRVFSKTLCLPKSLAILISSKRFVY